MYTSQEPLRSSDEAGLKTGTCMGQLLVADLSTSSIEPFLC